MLGFVFGVLFVLLVVREVASLAGAREGTDARSLVEISDGSRALKERAPGALAWETGRVPSSPPPPVPPGIAAVSARGEEAEEAVAETPASREPAKADDETEIVPAAMNRSRRSAPASPLRALSPPSPQLIHTCACPPAGLSDERLEELQAQALEWAGHLSPVQLALLLVSALVSVTGTILQYRGQATVPAASAQPIYASAPILAALWACLVLNEPISSSEAAGGLGIGAAALLASSSAARVKRGESDTP